MSSLAVLKIGGAVVDDSSRLEAFVTEVRALVRTGTGVVVVHGGGPQIDRLLAAWGHRTRRLSGLRVTDPIAMRAVEIALGGEVNRRVSDALAGQGLRPIRMNGRDDGCLRALPVARLGRVGKLTEVRHKRLARMVSQGIIPVIAPISAGPCGKPLNVNADEAAAEIAIALGALGLVFFTDVRGVIDERGEVVPVLDRDDLDQLLDGQHAFGGMVPKLKAARRAVLAGVERVHIVGLNAGHLALGGFGSAATLRGTQVAFSKSMCRRVG